MCNVLRRIENRKITLGEELGNFKNEENSTSCLLCPVPWLFFAVVKDVEAPSSVCTFGLLY